MLMLRIVFMLSLIATNLFPTASETPPPPPPIENTEIIPPPPATENEDIIPPPAEEEETPPLAPVQKEDDEVPPPPKTFEEHLATTQNVFTNAKGSITKFILNLKDPWLANIVNFFDKAKDEMIEEFSYTFNSIDNIAMNTNGSCIIIGAEKKFILFDRQENGHWVKRSSLQVHATSYQDTISANAQRVAQIINNNKIVTSTYNKSENKWMPAKTLEMPNIVSIKISGNGELLAILHKKTLSMYVFTENEWLPLDTITMPSSQETTLENVSFDGTTILCAKTIGTKSTLVVFNSPSKKESYKEIKINIDTLDSIYTLSDDGNYIIKVENYLGTNKNIYVYIKRNNSYDLLYVSEIYDIKQASNIIVTADANSFIVATMGGSLFIYQKKNPQSYSVTTKKLVNINYIQNGGGAIDLQGTRLAVYDTKSVNSKLLPAVKVFLLSYRTAIEMLNANQLNLIQDLYLQTEALKKANTPNKLIILGLEDIKIFKTMPKSIQLALRTLYKLTTQESVDAAQQKLKLKEKNKDRKTAAATISTSTPVAPSSSQAANKDAPINMEAVD